MDEFTKEVVTTVAAEVSKDVYTDLAKPVMQEIGKALGTVGKLLNSTLAPLRVGIYHLDVLEQKAIYEINMKANLIPEDKIIGPQMHIVGPILEGLKYTIAIDELRELYTSLLASSMNLDTVQYAHPAYAECIKQMSPLDATILKEIVSSNSYPHYPIGQVIFTHNSHRIPIFQNLAIFKNIDIDVELISSSIQNLDRLGLVNINYKTSMSDKDLYKELHQHSHFEYLAQTVPAAYKSLGDYDDFKVVLLYGIVSITSFGEQFIKVCL